MVFHENRLPADDSHEISKIICWKIRKDVAKFAVCCSRDWRLQGLTEVSEYMGHVPESHVLLLTSRFIYTYH